jgi:hypothetical protein
MTAPGLADKTDWQRLRAMTEAEEGGGTERSRRVTARR